MAMLKLGYLVVMVPCLIAALSLPLVWWKPDVFGPILLYAVFVCSIAGTILMSGAIIW